MKKKNKVDNILESKTGFIFYLIYRLFVIISILFLDICTGVFLIYVKWEWFYSLLIILVIASPSIYVIIRILIGIRKWFITHNKIKKLLLEYNFTKKIRDKNFRNSKERELRKKILKLYRTENDTPFDSWTTTFDAFIP
ncbi:MAG: hypothetical protein Ta2E_02820 [Mycoplasmoidaceae bacterium]|nr:MAG: hypothetical protein Ta2E_02820 [Mycoplasmoidaceae bacterium]